jgi:hypothetical protein
MWDLSTAPLLLNPRTGSIVSNYHVFDDWFSTVPTSVYCLPDFGSDEWTKLFGDPHHHDSSGFRLDKGQNDDDDTLAAGHKIKTSYAVLPLTLPHQNMQRHQRRLLPNYRPCRGRYYNVELIKNSEAMKPDGEVKLLTPQLIPEQPPPPSDTPSATPGRRGKCTFY